MTADTSIRTSPLAAWQDRLAGLAPALTAVERPFLTQLTVRASDPVAVARMGEALGVAFPGDPCAFTRGRGSFGDVAVLWLGPDEFLVMAGPDLRIPVEDVLRTALRPSPGAVVDTSAQRTAVALSGPHVRDVLAHGCAIDLHPSAAPTGTCVQTLLARAGIVLRVDDAGAGAFTVLVRSSFAGYLAAWLSDACVEYRAALS
ncbi:sarcosine oxidase subunit gamma [Nocardiopsis sp. Huas11]|uniref:sarcosine oxidase subunit gamma n=1 Tax=Nocardiopsis sp. Huas11 TaxID=2183912 RepID=UPI000EAD69E0|nr:sarcosine oxidase subunit gamma family protein [Nocardiopsis sp. Huas11]RKS09231.1 sarcosine oxidase subunit gamma [Nocardiopsis sp. Huas11]